MNSSVDNLPNLAFTKILNAKVDGMEIQKPNWRKILITVLEIAFNKGATVTTINNSCDLSLIPRRFDSTVSQDINVGYKYLQSLDLTLPPIDSNYACLGLSKIAQNYKIKIEINFMWYPNKNVKSTGKKAIIRF